MVDYNNIDKIDEVKTNNENIIKSKKLLNLEILLCLTASLLLMALIITSAYLELADWLRILLISIGTVAFMVAVFYALRIEQIAGYYKCTKCGNRYVPKYSQVLWAMHFGRTRYMKCPKCGQYSWNKKVLDNKD